MTLPSILIIDDEKELCLLLESFLAKKSSRIDHALNLREGIEKLRSMRPDILILDHNLPDGLGIDQIKGFKDQQPELRIVVISAMSNLRNTAIEKGADFFLEKPISFSQLTKIISLN